MPDNKRIAKNALLLYVRMLVVMAISLYTSRVVLQQLGVIDFGIYNVVGGVISMFAFLNSSMASSTQRFLTIDIGKGNLEQLNKTFNTSIQIHFLIAIGVVAIAESVGLWFLNIKMQIPADRMNAAHWVYQTAVISMFITFVNVPYTAIIIAYEKMGAFAYITIVEVVLKLAVAFLLIISPFDKLKFYSILMLLCPLIIRAIYGIYCNRQFSAVKIKRAFDKFTFKEMSVFAGWSLWGQVASIASTQGINILLNMFFGPAVNAARGIAVQIQGAVTQFSFNFQTAVNPQITKNYAVKNLEAMHTLICRSSKFTFYLLYTLVLPIIFGAPLLIKLWLGEVPDYTVSFLRIILLITIVDAVANPLMVAAGASGNIKKYQATIGGLLLAILPCAYLVLKIGGNPVSVFYVHLVISIIAFIARVKIVKPLIHIPPSIFFKCVIKECIIVALISTAIPLCMYLILPYQILDICMIMAVSVISVCISAYFIGLSMQEKSYVKEMARKIIRLL